jgi:hypothetical protein
MSSPTEQAVAVAIAEAVKGRIQTATELNHRDFTLRRSWLEWDLELKGLDDSNLADNERLHVDVVAHSTEQETEHVARGVVKYTVPVDIAVRRKYGQDQMDLDTGRIKVEEIDADVLFTQKLHLLFLPIRMGDFPFSVWDSDKGGTKLLANPHRDLLREVGLFAGIVRVYLRADVVITNG